MTVSYDSARATPVELEQAISQGRFKASLTDTPAPSPASAPPQRIEAPVPGDAPEFFVKAADAARRGRRPMVVVFVAEWCSACQRLKDETLHHQDVAEALSEVEVVEVDLDQWCDLGGWYGVTAVPHLVFIDRDGMIADSIQGFAPPETFLDRLAKSLKA